MLTVAQVQTALRVKHLETARQVMQELDRLGVMAYHEDGPGKPAHLCLCPEWVWIAKPSVRKLLLCRVR